jgi:membrane-bound acyltransferase YfiQ involved in biofilm formation
MRNRAFPNEVLLTLLVVATVLVVGSMLVPANSLVRMENAILITLSLGVMVKYGRYAAKAIYAPKHELEQVDYLAMGIVAGWASVACSRLFSIYAHVYGGISQYSPTVLVWTLSLGIVGATFHLAAPTKPGQLVDRGTWNRILFTSLVGLFVFLMAQQF